MTTLTIIILTLLAYWIIATIVIVVSKENDDVIAAFAFGIVGEFLIFIMFVIRKLLFYFKYRFRKRSVFQEEATYKNYKCHPKYTDDVLWVQGYRLVKRYAHISEHKDIPYFSKEFIEQAQINCEHCKYNDECECSLPYNKVRCKHDGYGVVLEFDKFEKRTKK